MVRHAVPALSISRSRRASFIYLSLERRARQTYAMRGHRFRESTLPLHRAIRVGFRINPANLRRSDTRTLRGAGRWDPLILAPRERHQRRTLCPFVQITLAERARFVATGGRNVAVPFFPTPACSTGIVHPARCE